MNNQTFNNPMQNAQGNQYNNPTANSAPMYNARTNNMQTKFCKYCGTVIPADAVICTACGRQVEELHNSAPAPQVIVNNSNVNSNINPTLGGRLRNKWVAFLLCFFLGAFGAHKFYEGKAGMGVLYIFTAGLFGIGWLVDLITILCKPNPYMVY